MSTRTSLPPSAPTTAAAAPSLEPRGTSIADLDDTTLLEILDARRKHGFFRVASALAMGFTAVIALRFFEQPPAWTLLILYGVPITVVLGMDPLLVALLRRRALRLGVPGHVFDELRRRMKGLPPRLPPYSAQELLAVVRAHDRKRA